MQRTAKWSIHKGKKQTTETVSERSLVLDPADKASHQLLQLFKELKEAMLKEVKESIMKMSH